MHTVIDVRNPNLYQGLAPSDIWRSYRRALQQIFDKADSGRNLDQEKGFTSKG
jgi:hypothetical protein